MQPNAQGGLSARDTQSIDAIIAALYVSICFEAGGEPDFERFRSLFVEGGRVVPAKPDDATNPAVLLVDDFIRRSRAFVADGELKSRGYVQTEIARTVESFGRVAHVFSTFEARFADEDSPFERGINSIQLLKEGDRWLIVTMLWETERKDLQIPEVYLGS